MLVAERMDAATTALVRLFRFRFRWCLRTRFLACFGMYLRDCLRILRLLEVAGDPVGLQVLAWECGQSVHGADDSPCVRRPGERLGDVLYEKGVRDETKTENPCGRRADLQGRAARHSRVERGSGKVGRAGSWTARRGQATGPLAVVSKCAGDHEFATRGGISCPDPRPTHPRCTETPAMPRSCVH